jgi:hypothetical protein
MSAWVREMRRVLLGKKDSSPPETVRCQEVKLVDAAGRTRVALTMTLDGSPWMSFYDAAGTGRLVMGLRPDGTPFLALWDATGHPLVEFPHDPLRRSTFKKVARLGARGETTRSVMRSARVPVLPMRTRWPAPVSSPGPQPRPLRIRPRSVHHVQEQFDAHILCGRLLRGKRQSYQTMLLLRPAIEFSFLPVFPLPPPQRVL